MKRDIYNVIVEDKVYVIYTDEYTGGCTYCGSVSSKLRLHIPRIREKALNLNNNK